MFAIINTVIARTLGYHIPSIPLSGTPDGAVCCGCGNAATHTFIEAVPVEEPMMWAIRRINISTWCLPCAYPTITLTPAI